MNRLFLVTISLLLLQLAKAEPIDIDASNISLNVREGHLKMGNPGQADKEIKVTSEYITFKGEPIIPVMGEIHFSRVPKEKWEESILKMKAAGIDIIAFYIIWIHHEETEGKFDWSGNKDVRSFVELCKKHHVWAYPRIGPWIHGEVRNGGMPDWLMKKEHMKLRTNDPAYLAYADRFYKEIGEQLKGLMYKDGGPIIGVQIENEYWRGKGGEDHIMWLKKTAQKYGFDVPLYTITGWRNTSLPEYEVIPLWGGYPTAPWNTDLKKITHNDAFEFVKPINDQSIGNREESRKYQPDYTPYPYLTCELGVGNQISEHRRPIVDPIDGYTIALSKVASGSNLPGYYVFTGGLNPVGKYTTMEEDQLESGYWNEYPDISYDFQAAIRETGEIAPAYHHVKVFHYFLNTFGNELAPMKAIISENQDNTNDLQYSFRTDGESGFLFVSNYYRGYQKSAKKNVQFSLSLKGEKVSIPEKPITINDSCVFVWPVNLPLNSAVLQQATAQPITKVKNSKYTDWYFKETKGIETIYSFKKNEISEIRYQDKVIRPNADSYIINNVAKGLSSYIEIKMVDGTRQRIFTLSDHEALNFWLFREQDQNAAFLSDANLTMDENETLEVFSTATNQTITALNTKIKPGENTVGKKGNRNGFTTYKLKFEKSNIPVEIIPADLIDEASWLTTSADEYTEKKSMFKKLFYKELDLSNTAKIRKATMYLISGQACDIRINDRWLNQTITSKKVNELDLTGYLENSENRCLLKFPYSATSAATAFALEVEYFNATKKVFLSDTSWHCSESYKIPAVWDALYKAKTPAISEVPDKYKDLSFTPSRYIVRTDTEMIGSFSDCYLRMNYVGDKAKLYEGEHLVADNFNNQTTWSINLTDVLKDRKETPVFEFKPYKKDYQIFFDVLPKEDAVGKIEINDYYTEPVYRSSFKTSF